MSETLKNAILNGLYDQKYQGHEFLNPQLLENDQNNKLWLNLRRELLACESFVWTVAFISENMLIPFKAVMADLAKKNISGEIITGTYLGFNSPKVFEELNKIPNLKLKIKDGPFHAKGYYFKYSNYESILVGSANFTRSALLQNDELMLKVTPSKNGALFDQVRTKIAKLEEESFLFTNNWLKEYRQNWVKPENRSISRRKNITPNKMQKDALKELNNLVAEKEKRALVVSATGTGKTYLGAFAVKNFKPRRFLYVVHRQQIAKKALASFKKVIGGSPSDYGILSGNHHDLNKKYLFATIQTLSQDHILKELNKEEFNYILIDEAHRVAAKSYRKIMNYFEPQFLLGMTATPERMDAQDVYQIFDYNLAYEIRLRDALEEKMLTPFHYVGVEDYETEEGLIDETSSLRYLTAEKRVDHILKELDYYGYCGSKPRGLVFCSRQEEAREIAAEFNRKGHSAVSLTNEDKEEIRTQAISDLENGKIEYIITVDLFNEGVDIPSLNQIVMLRNTQSSIVFIQQLGRGLRKYPGKDYVTVIDFIGNYKNNYLIPIALNLDDSLDKDQLKQETLLPQLIDLSTINFTQIASDKILQSLDKVKLDSLMHLKQSYKDLKQKIGRIPYLEDFYKYHTVSPEVFVKNKLLGNYGIFLQKNHEDIHLSMYENQVLTFMTKELLNGKRPHELILLSLLVDSVVGEEEYVQALHKNNVYIDSQVLSSVEGFLNLAFFEVKAGKTTKKEQYGSFPLVEKDLFGYHLSEPLQESLAQNNQFKKLFLDVIKTGLLLAKKYNWNMQFTLYQKYDREDVCRLLNWPLDVSAPMYGYRVGEEETPIFITYKKSQEDKRSDVYDNELQNGTTLKWYTRTPRHLDSAEVKRLLQKDMKLHIFVKRSDAEGKDFFYLGEAIIDRKSVKEEQIGPKKKLAVGMNLILKTPLTVEMYDLLFK